MNADANNFEHESERTFHFKNSSVHIKPSTSLELFLNISRNIKRYHFISREISIFDK